MGVISSRNVDVSPQNLLCQHGRGRWAVFGDFLDRLRGRSRAGGLERDVRLKMKGSTDSQGPRDVQGGHLPTPRSCRHSARGQHLL